MKICYVSSSGGHWEELMCLSELFNEYDSFFVTEEGGQADDTKVCPLYQVPQINRKEKRFTLHFINLIGISWKIIKREKPNFIITTGALIAFPFCILGKLMGIKVIYIESFARVNNASLTGRLCYPFADLFLIQWEGLKKYYPKSVYVGGIF